MTDKPFAGCIDMLEGMIADGSLDRFNDLADARQKNPADLRLTVFLDGTFVVHRTLDAEYAATCEPDYVASLDLTAVLDAIKAEGVRY